VRGGLTNEAVVINRSESRLIALERRNQAERSKQKASRPASISKNDTALMEQPPVGTVSPNATAAAFDRSRAPTRKAS
jgi:hypothetical protein